CASFAGPATIGQWSPARRTAGRALADAGIDVLAGLDEAANGLDALVEHGALLGGEFDLDHLLHAVLADDARHADIDVVEAVFALEVGRARQQPALVPQVGLGHQHGAFGRRVIGRARLQQVDDLGAAVARALHDLVELFLAGPAHLH